MSTWKPPIIGEITETFAYSTTGPTGSVTYRTEGLRGGDAGHGAFLEITFDTQSGSTALSAMVEAGGIGAVQLDAAGRVRLTFEGDGEILAAVQCFEFLAEKLRATFPNDDAAEDAHARCIGLVDESRVVVEDRGNETSNLHCPRCDSSYLHQGAVIVWDRSEDERVEAQTVVTGAQARTGHVNARTSGNPSARRQGMAIRFECENCSKGADDRIELVLAQHKGETEIGWRHLPRAEEG